MSRLIATLAAAAFLFTLSAGAQEPPKPKPKPGESAPKNPPPPKRSHFCTGKSDGWYCGENNEPKLFLCKNGFIEDGKDCPAGCTSGNTRCNSPGK